MSERAHTPGPWRVDDRYDDQIIGRPTWPCRRSGVEGEWQVATADLMDGNEAEMAANARLIASAPDLLDACKRASEILRGRGSPGWGVAKDILNEAIAKAEGRSLGHPELPPHEMRLVTLIMAQPADADGWREHPIDLTSKDSEVLNRWWRSGWIDLEETPVLRVKERGERIFQAALSKASPSGDPSHG